VALHMCAMPGDVNPRHRKFTGNGPVDDLKTMRTEQWCARLDSNQQPQD